MDVSHEAGGMCVCLRAEFVLMDLCPGRQDSSPNVSNNGDGAKSMDASSGVFENVVPDAARHLPNSQLVLANHSAPWYQWFAVPMRV